MHECSGHFCLVSHGFKFTKDGANGLSNHFSGLFEAQGPYGQVFWPAAEFNLGFQEYEI